MNKKELLEMQQCIADIKSKIKSNIPLQKIKISTAEDEYSRGLCQGFINASEGFIQELDFLLNIVHKDLSKPKPNSIKADLLYSFDGSEAMKIDDLGDSFTIDEFVELWQEGHVSSRDGSTYFVDSDGYRLNIDVFNCFENSLIPKNASTIIFYGK